MYQTYFMSVEEKTYLLFPNATDKWKYLFRRLYKQSIP